MHSVEMIGIEIGTIGGAIAIVVVSATMNVVVDEFFIAAVREFGTDAFLMYGLPADL
jgi:hypothetical protein